MLPAVLLQPTPAISPAQLMTGPASDAHDTAADDMAPARNAHELAGDGDAAIVLPPAQLDDRAPAASTMHDTS
jgi:hypothetical protein